VSVPIKLLPVEERPREKLLREGAEKLTDAELLAIILRTGVRGRSVIELAHQMLQHCRKDHPENPLGHLLRFREGDIRSIVPGIGEAKLCQVLAALQLGVRAQAEPLTTYDVGNPRAAFEHLAPRISWREQEQFMVILLNAKNHVISVEEVTEGTQTSTLVHPREIFKAAIRKNAHAIILVHNHPSGDPTPSREDREITLRLKEAGRTLGIEVLDHLVIGDRRYVSFRERGLVDWS
jgi:DNA repair protein RadC